MIVSPAQHFEPGELASELARVAAAVGIPRPAASYADLFAAARAAPQSRSLNPCGQVAGGLFGPGNTCAAGDGASILGADPSKPDVPTEPGKSPVPPGHVRLYHYTNAGEGSTPTEEQEIIDSLAKHGIDKSKARGETYGEGNAVWASTAKPDDGKVFVEFSVPWNDPRMYPKIESPELIAEAERMGHNYRFFQSIKPTEFVAVHRPFHHHVRYIRDNADVLEETLSGKNDFIIKSGRATGQAVEFVKTHGRSLNPCGQVAGGLFGPGNTCAAGDGDAGGGGSSAEKTSPAGVPGIQEKDQGGHFAKWRDANKEWLDKLRGAMKAVAWKYEKATKAAFAAYLAADEKLEAIDIKPGGLTPEQSAAAGAHDDFYRAVLDAATLEEKQRIIGEAMKNPSRVTTKWLLETPREDPKLEAMRTALVAAYAKAFPNLEEVKRLREESQASYQKWKSLCDEARTVAFGEIGKQSRGVAMIGGVTEARYDEAAAAFAATKISHTIDPAITRPDGPQQVITDAWGFFSSVINPTSFAADGLKRTEVKTTARSDMRAFMHEGDEDNGSEITLGSTSGIDTAIHELGHCVEFSANSVSAAAVDFQAHRCGGSRTAQMNEFAGGSGRYRDTEFGNADNFAATVAAVRTRFGIEGSAVSEASVENSAAYCGKVYRYGPAASSPITATELVSCGFEFLYTNPTAFAKADPEYFDFVIGVATGAL